MKSNQPGPIMNDLNSEQITKLFLCYAAELVGHFDVEALKEFVFTSIVDNLESVDLETAFEVMQSDFDEETLNEWIKDIKKDGE